MISTIPITPQDVQQFELLMARATEALMQPIAAQQDNGQGYAFFHRGDCVATLSTNPYARWTVSAYGLTGADPQAVEEALGFFQSHNVPAKVRIVPGHFSAAQADLLTSHGLRHIGFHTVLHSPLPLPHVPPAANISVSHVTDPAEYDIALDTYHRGWGLDSNPDSHLLKIRRAWRTLECYRSYLAYLDKRPAAFAMLYSRPPFAYLSSASTIPSFRNRGLQSTLIQRRIADAVSFGCTTILGGATFDSPSRSNMMRAGLQIAYTAAIWEQPVPPLPHEQNRP
jgi:hypothetical protein